MFLSSTAIVICAKCEFYVFSMKKKKKEGMEDMFWHAIDDTAASERGKKES